jgi:acetyl-CoA C-acetyltransferase
VPRQRRFLGRRVIGAGEAHPKVQVPGCTLAVAHGTGGLIATRHGSATLVMERI